MLQLIFPLLIIVHGLIHLLGVSKAPGYKNPISGNISSRTKIIWAAATTSFLVTAAMILLQYTWWVAGSISVVLSQALITFYWKDAKYGTIVNLIILPAIVSNFAEWNFSATSKKAASIMLATDLHPLQTITEQQIYAIPPLVQKWLRRSGVVNKSRIVTVALKQQGMLRTKPGAKWMPMNAEQYFTVNQPAFVWHARIDAGMMHIAGQDVYANGKGHMLIKAASIVPVADATGDETDQGTMLRYLAETEWFPSAALSPYIKWEQLNDSVAKAIMTYGGMSVTGNFTFNTNGDITKFEALRYMEQNGRYTLETWVVPVTEWGVFDGIRIPIKGHTIWKLRTGDFDWFRWEITDIEYNRRTTY